MKKIILSLILNVILSANVIAATGSGNVSSVTTLGGVNTTDNLIIPNSNPDGYFSLYAASTLTASNVTPFYKNGVAYKVTNGKTFVVSKICWTAGAPTARLQLLTDTVTFAPNATTASLTAPVYQGGAAGRYEFTSLSTFVYVCHSASYNFAQNTYPGIQGQDATTHQAIVIGKEI